MTVIKVENVGKRYILPSMQQERYETFRGMLKNNAVHAWQRAWGQRPPRKNEEFWALRDVSFEIKAGERLGIIGRNGAGKSTLLKLLSRITEPTHGRITMCGRVGSLLEVGTGFHPELTGRENIYLNGAVLGMSHGEIRKKFDEIVAFAEVEKFLDTPVKRYSSGMYVRLAFAVAAHLEPDILIIDEVLAVGDAQFQKKCIGKMDEFGRNGRTVLFVSHHMEAVLRLCQRAIFLEKGRVIMDSTDVSAVVNRYSDLGLTDANKAEWLATPDSYKDDYFTPTRLTITDDKGGITKMPTLNSHDIFIRIEGISREVPGNLQVGFALYNDENRLLFFSVHTDGAEESWPVMATGSNCIVARIPRRLLNQGHYRVQLISLLGNEKWLLDAERSQIFVELHIAGGMSDSPAWIGVRPGILAPVLSWQQGS